MAKSQNVFNEVWYANCYVLSTLLVLFSFSRSVGISRHIFDVMSDVTPCHVPQMVTSDTLLWDIIVCWVQEKPETLCQNWDIPTTQRPPFVCMGNH